MAIDSRQVEIVEQTLKTVFPDDCSLIGDERVHQIASEPSAAAKRAPPLGGDKFDLMPILHDLKDVAEFLIAVIALWRASRPQQGDKKLETGKFKDDVKERIQDGRLKASETVLKKADTLIDDVISSLEKS